MKTTLKITGIIGLIGAAAIACSAHADASPQADIPGFLTAVHTDGMAGGNTDGFVLQVGAGVCKALESGYKESVVIEAIAATNTQLTFNDARNFVYDAEIYLCRDTLATT